jgi:putative membrane protein
MFIDYLTLIMLDLLAGLGLLAHYLYAGLDRGESRSYAAGFGAVGVLGLILGLGMVFTWPLPGSYNIVFGEATVLFSLAFLAAGVALGLGWDLRPVTVYAFFAGLYAVIGGARIISLGLTKEPLLSGLGFILAGLMGVLAAPAWRLLQTRAIFRRLAALALLAVAVLWGVTFYNALWGHLATFKDWLPLTMR